MPQAITAILDADIGPVLGPFVRGRFAGLRLGEVSFREQDTPFDGDEVTLAVSGRELLLRKLGPAHSDADVIGYVPDAGVLFAAGLLFIGSTRSCGPARSRTGSPRATGCSRWNRRSWCPATGH